MTWKTLGELNLNRENKKLSSLLDGAVFPGTQGGPLEHIIAAKAVAFEEASKKNLKTTLKTWSKTHHIWRISYFIKYKIVSNGTENHCILIDLRNKNITGKDAEFALGLADITVNKNMVPFDDKSPFVTSGIRIGTAAITTRGVAKMMLKLLLNLLIKLSQKQMMKKLYQNQTRSKRINEF